MVTITVELRQEVENKARSMGLLTGEKIAELIEAEVERKRQAAARLLDTMEQLSDDMRQEFGDLTDEEAQAMIDQWLAESDESEPLSTSTAS